MNGKPRRLIEFAIASIIAFSLLIPIYKIGHLQTYQARDLLRAQEVLRGNLIFFGPEASGGGYLPGGAYYYFLAALLSVGLHWEGIFYAMLFLHALGIGFLWTFFRGRNNTLGAVFSSTLFLCSFNLTYVLAQFLNSSFLPLLSIGIFIAFIRSFEFASSDQEKEPKQRFYWFLGCLLLGLAFQFHFTTITFLLGMITIQLFGRYIGVRPLQWRLFSQGIILFLITLLPYTIWWLLRAKSYSLGQLPLPLNATKFGTSALKYYYNEFSIGAAGMTTKQTLQILSDLFIFPEILAPIAGLIFIFYDRYLLKNKPEKISIATKLSFIFLFFGFLPGFYQILCNWYEWNVRYSINFQVCLVFVCALVFENINWPESRFIATLPGRRFYWGLGTCACILAYTLFKLPYVQGRSAKPDFDPYYVSYDKLHQVAALIHKQTGWDYRELKRRLFLINFYNSVTFAPLDELKKSETINSINDIDGYIAGIKFPREVLNSKTELANWLKSSHVETSVLQALERKELELRIELQDQKYLVASYHFMDPYRKGDHFQNVGLPYAELSAEDLSIPPDVYYNGNLNNCPNREEICNDSIQLWQKKNKEGLAILKIAIQGPTMAQPNFAMIPEWTESLWEIFINLSCNGLKFRLSVAQTLGKTHQNDQFTQHELFTPFERSYKDPCDGNPLENANFEYSRSEVRSNFTDINLPGRTLLLQKTSTGVESKGHTQ